MIYRPEEKDYEKVRPLFKPLDFNLTVIGVIEGTSPGILTAVQHLRATLGFYR